MDDYNDAEFLNYTREKIHEELYHAAGRGNVSRLISQMKQLQKKNIPFDPFWCSKVEKSNILCEAAASGSHKCVSIIRPYIKIPDDDTIFREDPVINTKRYSTRTQHSTKTSYFLCKPYNPFFDTVRACGTPKRNSKPSYVVHNVDSDDRVVKTLKVLEEILFKLPIPHQRKIMNEGILFKAIEWGLYKTVKHLMQPTLCVDLFAVDIEVAGGTYSCVDYAIRTESNIKNFNINFSITKLLWDATDGIRGSIESPGNKGISESRWLIENGIISKGKSESGLKRNLLWQKKKLEMSDDGGPLEPEHQHPSITPDQPTTAPLKKKKRCRGIRAIPDPEERSKDHQSGTEVAIDNISSMELEEMHSCSTRVPPVASLNNQASPCESALDLQSIVSAALNMHPRNPTVIVTCDILREQGYYTLRTISSIQLERLSELLQSKIGLIAVHRLFNVAKNFKLQKLSRDHVEKVENALDLARLIDGDLTRKDLALMAQGLETLFGENMSTLFSLQSFITDDLLVAAGLEKLAFRDLIYATVKPPVSH